MIKHTQGPWSIELDHASNTSEFIRARIDGEMHDIASLLCDETGNASANARLIAAAPAMLDALHEALAMLNDPDADTADAWRVQSRIESVIAKAIGQEEAE